MLNAIENQVDAYLCEQDRLEAEETSISDMMDSLISELPPGISESELRELAILQLNEEWISELGANFDDQELWS